VKHKSMESALEIYVCQYGKDCSKKNSLELTDQLKKWAKEETSGQIKVVRSGCLGQCEAGIAIACYPDRRFILGVDLKDCEEIKKGLNEALERLKT
jgi:(2Fe-2S) ferredoxin